MAGVGARKRGRVTQGSARVGERGALRGSAWWVVADGCEQHNVLNP